MYEGSSLPTSLPAFVAILFAFLMLDGTSRKDSISSAGDVRDVGLIPGSGRSLGVGNGNLLQYSCLENYMDRGAWRAAVHKVAKSWTWLSDWIFTFSLQPEWEWFLSFQKCWTFSSHRVVAFLVPGAQSWMSSSQFRRSACSKYSLCMRAHTHTQIYIYIYIYIYTFFIEV